MTSDARLLLADDDESDARLALAALKAAGVTAEVRVVTDGQEALDYLFRRGPFADRPPGQPAVVLLDLKMPRVDGFEVLARVKKDPVLRVIPMIVLTSSRQDRDLVRAYELGANGYVVKALRFDAYSAALCGLIRYWLDINEAPPASLWSPGSPGRRPGLERVS